MERFVSHSVNSVHLLTYNLLFTEKVFRSSKPPKLRVPTSLPTSRLLEVHTQCTLRKETAN